jgi:hypothetical protein
MMNYEGLLEPQKNHAVSLLNSLHLHGVAFDSSQTGCGKTYVAAWIAKNFNAQVVVICPKVVKKTWETVLSKFGIKAHLVINYEKITRGHTPHYTYDRAEYDKSKYWWESKGISVNFPDNALVIVDEVHKAKGLHSLNSELITAIKNAGMNLLMLSATAATNVTEMKAFGFVTNLHNGSQFRNWTLINGVKYNNYGSMVWDNSLTECQMGLKNIHNSLANVMQMSSRMTRDMFGTIFPDNRISADSFDLGDVNTKKFNDLANQMEAELAALDERSKTYSEHHFAILMRFRRHAELLKVPVMVDWLEDMFDEGISPIVFVNFNDTKDAILNRLSKLSKFNGLVGCIVGGQSEKQRNQDIEDFQSDKKRIMVVNIAAGNAGISLHDLNGKFPRHTLINLSWSAINLLQSLGRAHRAEGKSPVVQKLLFATGTIEDRIKSRVEVKIKNIDLFNDGDLSFEIDLN